MIPKLPPEAENYIARLVYSEFLEVTDMDPEHGLILKPTALGIKYVRLIAYGWPDFWIALGSETPVSIG